MPEDVSLRPATTDEIVSTLSLRAPVPGAEASSPRRQPYGEDYRRATDPAPRAVGVRFDEATVPRSTDDTAHAV